jgi:peptide subunit release factor 1 (eRF1)
VEDLLAVPTTSGPANGLTWFHGYWREGDSEEVKSFSLELEPALPLQDSEFFFLAGARFHTQALHRVLEELAGPRFGICIFDYTGLLFAALRGSTLEIVQRVSMQIPRFRPTFQSRDTLLAKSAALLASAFTDHDREGQPNVRGLVVRTLAPSLASHVFCVHACTCHPPHPYLRSRTYPRPRS